MACSNLRSTTLNPRRGSTAIRLLLFEFHQGAARELRRPSVARTYMNAPISSMLLKQHLENDRRVGLGVARYPMDLSQTCTPVLFHIRGGANEQRLA